MKLTEPLERVLRAFLEDPSAPRYGYDLMKSAKLPSGTLYPMLARLEDQGLVTSAWETPSETIQRPRKYYQLSGEGVRIVRLELAEQSAKLNRRSAGRMTQPAPGTAT
jgi:PadR family transcriptional regulator, regulatory protein PadR